MKIRRGTLCADDDNILYPILGRHRELRRALRDGARIVRREERLGRAAFAVAVTGAVVRTTERERRNPL